MLTACRSTWAYAAHSPVQRNERQVCWADSVGRGTGRTRWMQQNSLPAGRPELAAACWSEVALPSPAGRVVCVKCQLVPGPRLELLGCCMLRQSGCGSNPGDQTVGARRTRGGLASPDWLEQETSEERRARCSMGRLKTRTLAFTQQISRTPTVRDGCCERNRARAWGRAPY